MIDHEKSPGADSAEAHVCDAVHDLHTILPRSSQELIPLLREAEGQAKKQIIQALSYFVRRGVPAGTHFEIQFDQSPKKGILIEMDFQGERTLVLILNWLPSIVFDFDAYWETVWSAWQSDAARDDVIYCLRNWASRKQEIINATNRAAMLAELVEEHDGFEALMKPLLDAPNDPRRWLSAPPSSCPVYVARAPERKAAR